MQQINGSQPNEQKNKQYKKYEAQTASIWVCDRARCWFCSRILIKFNLNLSSSIPLCSTILLYQTGCKGVSQVMSEANNVQRKIIQQKEQAR